MLLVEVILENHREADFERFLAAIRKRNEVLECYKIGGRIDYLMRVLCRDIDHYNEPSDFMSRGELGVEKFHGHVVLAIDKAFQGYPLELLHRAARAELRARGARCERSGSQSERNGSGRLERGAEAAVSKHAGEDRLRDLRLSFW